jgi:STE24 endopeptidase
LITAIFSEITGYSKEIYSNFIVKERHGFNNMTIGVYAGDKVKEYLLTAVIGLPIYYGFMKLIIWGGE